MGKKRFSLWLCIWTLTLGLFCFPTAPAMTLEEPRPGGETTVSNTYHLTLDTRVIGSGETLSYETVAPELAGNPFAADYYPGKLTVELTGQIIIEDGGCLAIGTLSSENEKEQSPVLRGRCSPDGLIVVRSGGSLILKNVSLAPEGEGLLIVQEAGGSVELTDMEPEDGLIAWAPPVVENTYQKPADLWLEEGTAFAGTMLPDTLNTYLQYRGTQRLESLALRWNTAPLDGQTGGEATLMGAFLDENGETLASVRPLTLTVHWYKPDRLIVTDTAWLGQTAATAKLRLKALPEEAGEVWGEVAAGGETWVRWEQFQCREEGNSVACVFSLPDSTPRRFRVRAANERKHLYWSSEAVLLPKEETEPSDQSGNRGGSTAVTHPSRTPEEPEPTPTPTPSPTPVPTPTLEPTPAPPPTPPPAAEPVPTPSAEYGILEMTPSSTPGSAGEPTTVSEVTPPAAVMAPVTPASLPPAPVPTVRPTPAPPSPEPTAVPPVGHGILDVPPTSTVEPSPTPSPSPAAVKAEGPAPILQVLLVAAGAMFCALVGVFTARRKRK